MNFEFKLTPGKRLRENTNISGVIFLHLKVHIYWYVFSNTHDLLHHLFTSFDRLNFVSVCIEGEQLPMDPEP